MPAEPFDSEDDEGSSDGSSEDDSLDQVAVEKTKTQREQIRKDARHQHWARTVFRSQFALAASVGFWVAVFGYPMYNLSGYKWIFGFRGTLLNTIADEIQKRNLSVPNAEVLEKLHVSCPPLATGKMRNFAGPFEQARLEPWEGSMTPWNSSARDDIWCGILNSNYLDYWPNVAQLIIFTVYKNHGTTINLAWQGIIGTFFACANMVLMQSLYPAGAAGHQCFPGTAAWGWTYTTIWHMHDKFKWRISRTVEEARFWYSWSGRHGGLDTRAIIDGDGQQVEGWFLNPELEHQTMAKFLEIRGENCTAGTMVYDSPGYKWWVCLLDVVVVLFLFLISGAAKNTIMFGMSWHVCFMMDFMNPEKGVKDCATWSCILSESVHSVVLRTTIIGAFVSILATFTCSICLPLSHYRNLYEDSLAMTQAIIRIWRESLEYLSGRARCVKRFQIETQIFNLSNGFQTAAEDADGAWWETFELGRFGNTRRLLAEYNVSSTDIRDLMVCVRGCVLHEDFKGNHMLFCKIMAEPMTRLQREAEELMFAILVACKDGAISREESLVIREITARVKEQQRALVRAFNEASPEVSDDLSEENIFAFALSFWARKMTDFAESIAGRNGMQNWWERRKNWCLTMSKSLWIGWVATWSPAKMCEVDHLKYCLRNWISISLLFIFSYFTPSGSVFVQYSPTMPSTLTLLIVGDGSHQIGSMIYKNTQRLLGVVLGKVLPILAMWLYYYFPCLSYSRFYIQAATTWFYVFFFTYTYYLSSMWGYVGCLIAGFGVYQLLVPCSGDPKLTFENRYQEIGSVTFAIVVQALIHILSSRHTPVQLELDALKSLCNRFVGGYEAFFDSDLPAMQEAARDLEAALAQCKAILPECDPKLKAVSCGERDFKYQLCSQVLRYMDHLLGEFNLLIVSAKDWVPNEAVKGDGAAADDADIESAENASTGVLQMLRSRPAMALVKEEFMGSLRNTMEMIRVVMADEPVKEDFDQIRAVMELAAAPDLYVQLAALRSQRNAALEEELTNVLCARLTIAVKALENSEYHLYKIAESCLREFPV